jgi:hypothetical protein
MPGVAIVAYGFDGINSKLSICDKAILFDTTTFKIFKN